MELPTMPDLIDLDAEEMAAVNGGADMGPPIVDIWDMINRILGIPGASLPPISSAANMC
jgi:hypothetical protein